MTSVPTSDGERASVLWREANELYLSGKFLPALRKYQEYANLQPPSYALLDNISAAYFEVGDYGQCSIEVRKALDLLQIYGSGDATFVEKLQQRIKNAELLSYESSGLKQQQTRLRILERLPRYRPTFATTRAYCTVGNEKPTSLFDLTIGKNEPTSNSVSFLFGDIGDARNLLQTIAGIAELEKKHRLKQKQYHLTMVDVSRNTLTRDLIIFMLLEELSGLETKSKEAEEVLTTLFFVFVAFIMPRIAYNHLYRTIDRALSALQSDMQPLSWIYLPRKDFLFYIQTLESWKGRASTTISAPTAVDEVTRQLRRDQMLLPSALRRDKDVPAPFKKENKLYKSTAILIPPKTVSQNHDREILPLLQAHIKNPEKKASKFREHVRNKWNFNTTRMDLDWYDFLEDKHDFDFANDPFLELDNFASVSKTLPTKMKAPATLYDYIAPFFSEAADSIKYLRGRLQVEAICEDFVEVAEKLRFGLYRDNNSLQSSEAAATDEIRCKNFPVLYDRIYLGNVADYIGGHLSSYLHASPLLKPLSSSFVQSNLLRNVPDTVDIEKFLAEYHIVADTKMAEQLTSVTVLSRAEGPWPTGNYIRYGISQSLFRGFEQLLPRKPFKRWLYALFFRLAIPFPLKMTAEARPISSPLTLTIIFRIIAHLRIIGYPCHWMADVLSRILENTVQTKVSTPHQSQTPAKKEKREHTRRHLCTTPFVQEMATLTRIFEPLLPFLLPSPAAIPEAKNIFNYKFHLSNISRKRDPSIRLGHLTLLFYDYGALRKCGMSIPVLLFSIVGVPTGEKDEADKSAEIENFRENGLFVWTTIEYDAEHSIVRAWMPSDFVEKMERDLWRCGLWRVDTWENVHSGPFIVRGSVLKGERWEGNA
ncbi:33fe9913-89e2-439c-a543-4123e27a11e9 [Sclerotinia trifoliorum]|uniref:33fe9913-89e2-439c-a543-4123e27a11e9 n=1 Tax=Sclerotinia trifoliorum TaxID=28548 RepID=A0A8H2VQX6_9HELO|nr:33fe9913-89e2-439c-a543-4123e27a11e9 [Sclerotinia trifoliorum]